MEGRVAMGRHAARAFFGLAALALAALLLARSSREQRDEEAEKDHRARELGTEPAPSLGHGREEDSLRRSRARSSTEQPASPTSRRECVEDDERIEHYAADTARRIALLAEKKAGFVLSLLPADFCRLHPRECSALEQDPERACGDVIAPVDARRLSELLASEEARSAVLDNRRLADLFESLRGYATSELMANRGRCPHTTIDACTAEFSSLIWRFSRPEEFLAAVGEYGQAILEEEAHFGEPRTEAGEEKLTALLWEERCRRENRLIDTLPAEVGFWIHASRVMTRHVYDDSYWLAPDELSAAEETYPDHLRTR